MATTASNRQPRTARRSSAPANATPNAGQGGRDTSAGPVQRPSEFRMNRIAHRAHEIYEARGGEHGKAMEDWLQAEREIDAAIETARTDQ